MPRKCSYFGVKSTTSVTSGARLASLHKNFFFGLGSPEAGMIEVTSVSQKFASEVMW